MIVATAGHIDHGKTRLVGAITGVDTDRLPEEKARGISIDLGFAYWSSAGGALIGFVDVPGHERFVRNMLAGVCGIDFAMVVVAADDGVMPQTVEHLQILDLLGIRRGLVVMSKVDRADNARRGEVQSEIAATQPLGRTDRERRAAGHLGAVFDPGGEVVARLEQSSLVCGHLRLGGDVLLHDFLSGLHRALRV